MNRKKVFWGLAIWVGIPLLFAIFARLTYSLGVNRAGSRFYAGEMYWFLSLVGFVISGVLLLRLTGVTQNGLVWVVYMVVVGALLFVLQGAIACMSGDCF